MRHGRRWLLTAALLVGFECLAAARVTAEFDLPAQPLSESLRRVAEEFDLQIAFYSESTSGLSAPALRGAYTPLAAFEVLLANTPLEFAYVNDTSVVIRPHGMDNGIEGENTMVIGNRSPRWVGETDKQGELVMGKSSSRKSIFARIGAALAAVVLSGPAHAETAVPGAGAKPQVIEEITVTARRTEENLQQVPMTVTALTPEKLEQQNIVRATELMYAVPSLTVAPRFNSMLNSFAVRGLARGVTNYLAESDCCTGNASMAFLDIQSVQVLSGPQGTLFGRTSAAGAVLIEPARPDLNEFEGSLKVRLGDYARQEFTGMVNVPIIEDMLAIRLAANSMDVEGYTEDIGSSNKQDEQKGHQVRLGIQFDNGRFSNYTALGYIRMDQSSTSSVLTGINLNVFPFNLPDAFAPATYGAACAGAVSIGLNPDVASCVAERVAIVDGIEQALIAEQARIQTGGDSAIRRTPATQTDFGVKSFIELEDWHILNVAQFDDMDWGRVQVSVKDVFSYESIADLTGQPGDGIGGIYLANAAFSTGAGGGGAGRNNTRNGKVVTDFGPADDVINNDFNATFDLNDGLLVTTLGFYYSRRESPRSNTGTNNITRLYGGVTQPDLGFFSFAPFSHSTETTQRAWYTQSTLDASTFGIEGLTVTAGYRKSWDKGSVVSRAALYDLPTGSFFPGPTLNETKTESDGYNYLFTVAQQFTDDFMAYVTHSRAYVPGGANIIVTGGIEDLPNYSPTYGPEIVKSWEAGAKLDFLLGENVPVRLNAAVYNYDYSDIVVLLVGFAQAPVSYRANAAAAELTGFELSGAIIPIEGLEISFSYNYNDSKFNEWNATHPYGLAQPGDARCLPISTTTTCVIDLTDNPFSLMPEHQGHVTVAYTLPLAESLGRLTLSANVYAQSRVWFGANTTNLIELLPDAKPLVSQESYSILNLRANWNNMMGSGFDTAVFVNNATDEVYARQKINQLDSVGTGVAHYAAPRMWGVEVAKKF